jgi:hypothetical protein
MVIGSIGQGIRSKGYLHMGPKAEAPEALAVIANAPQFPIDSAIEWGRPEISADLALALSAISPVVENQSEKGQHLSRPKKRQWPFCATGGEERT